MDDQEMAGKIARRSMHSSRPKSLYRTMRLSELENMLRSRTIRSRDYWVSLSSRPIRDDLYGDVVVEFSGYMPDRVEKVVYDYDWMLEHPRIAKYVVGQDAYGGESEEELARRALAYEDEDEWPPGRDDGRTDTRAGRRYSRRRTRLGGTLHRRDLLNLRDRRWK